jgi:sugar phosphate isomerase/epimerase
MINHGPIPQLALQMYTLRNMTNTIEERLSAVAAAGYSAIETFGPLAPPALDLRLRLDAVGLQVVSAHVGLDMLTADLPGVVAWHQALGNSTLVVPWLQPDQRPLDVVGWAALGSQLAALGARCRDWGMSLLYHNHDFEMATWDGRTVLEWMLDAAEQTIPGALGAELDLAWVVRGGQDPITLLQRLRGRVPRAHAKDVAPAGSNDAEAGHADVGYGTIDWTAVLPAAWAAGVEWLVVEHDEPSDPLRTIQRSAGFLRDRWPVTA